MIKQKILLILLSVSTSFSVFSQATVAVTDTEKKYIEVKEMMIMEAYAQAYPLTRELKAQYADNTVSDHAYINEDVNFYYIVCELKLMLDVAKDDAEKYIHDVNNEPRRQILSFHLGHYYFLKDDYVNAIASFNKAGYDNLSNDQIADAKFEKAYSHFNLKHFEQAKPLFNEIIQIPGNKYFIPANYYYGFIAYYNKQ